MSNTKYKNRRPAGGGTKGEFVDFRIWYDARGEAWRMHLQREVAPAESPRLEFKSLDGLVKRTKDIAEKMEELD